MIAISLAINYPHLVKKMVLGSSSSKPNETIYKVFNHWIDIAKTKDVPALNRDFFEKVYSEEFKKNYKEVLKTSEQNGTASDCMNFIIYAKACTTFNAYDKLDKIKCPVLVIGSDKDCVLTGPGSREIAEKIGCEIYMYSGYAHAVYDEAPDYKQRLLDFFNK